MPETYTIKYDMTWAEYFEVSVSVFSRLKFVRTLVLFLPVLALLSALLADLAPGANHVTTWKAYLPVILAPLGVIGFFLVACLLLTTLVFFLKPDLVKGHTYRFSSAGMERILPDGRRFAIPWSNISHLKETRSFFWLHMKSNNLAEAQVIQKRMFADRELAEEFKKYVQRHLPL